MGDRTILSELWDTTRMRLLVEIDRRGSVSSAARAIGIGQPTASQHLRLLEAAAGQRLVERDGRGSRLTEAGRILARRAAEALATLDAASEELDELSGLQRGTIHLGASTVPGVYLLPDTLGCFRRDYPNVTVHVEIAGSAEILERLVSGRIQMAIVGSDVANDRVRLEPFLDDEMVGIAKPGLLASKGGVVEPRALDGKLMLSREPASSSRALAERALLDAGVEPGAVWELGSSEAIKRSAREGLGVAFLSRYAVAEEVERGELEAFRLAGRPRIVRRFSVASRNGRPLSPSERAFVATLTRCCTKSQIYAAACVAAPARADRAKGRRPLGPRGRRASEAGVSRPR
jgi:molybdate transport repressor ModE-like protein